MKHSIKTGLSFGLASGIITTLGLIVGLHSGTHSKSVIIGGILTIAIADAFSDALGIHISEESENTHSTREIWESTLFTFIGKFVFAMSFIFPLIFIPLPWSIGVSILWGVLLISIFSFFMARSQKVKTWKVVFEHVFIVLVVIGVTHYIGDWITITFNNG